MSHFDLTVVFYCRVLSLSEFILFWDVFKKCFLHQNVSSVFVFLYFVVSNNVSPPKKKIKMFLVMNRWLVNHSGDIFLALWSSSQADKTSELNLSGRARWCVCDGERERTVERGGVCVTGREREWSSEVQSDWYPLIVCGVFSWRLSSFTLQTWSQSTLWLSHHHYYYHYYYYYYYYCYYCWQLF